MSTSAAPRLPFPPTISGNTSTPKPATGKTPSPSRSSSSKRLLQELNQLRSESQLLARAQSSGTTTERSPIERLGPISDEDFLHWEAVINGRGLGAGYEEGRWLVDILVNGGASGSEGSGSGSGSTYPNRPPVVRFLTKVVAANVGFENGEICLDLLKDAWSPAYTLKRTIEAIWQMLAAPGVDSPLNVDIAALIRQGDRVGAEAVVRWGCEEWKYEGR